MSGHASRRLNRAANRLSPSQMQTCALLLQKKGDLAGAEKLLREALRAQEDESGPRHPDVLRTKNNLGWLLKAAGQMDEAALFMREALEAQREVLGSRHPDTLTSMNKLGLLLSDVPEARAEAAALCHEALASRREVLGPRHEDTLLSTCALGLLMYEIGELRLSRKLLFEASSVARETLGEGHPYTRNFTQQLAAAERAIERDSQALFLPLAEPAIYLPLSPPAAPAAAPPSGRAPPAREPPPALEEGVAAQ
jgi:tetratricopeptide (TPR) repeat protein